MKAILKKDIVIKAGTVFGTAPKKTERFGDGHFEHIFGLSKDTAGSLVYYIGMPGEEERSQTREWFDLFEESDGKDVVGGEPSWEFVELQCATN